jgi:NTE family protein
VRRLDKFIRSVQAFGRGLSSAAKPPADGIGLALGGGFARGIAHIGVLKVLEEENIPIAYVAGTSVGALIGAAYCSGLSTGDLEEVARQVRFKHFARWTLSRYGFASNQRMIGFLNRTLKVKTFEELRLPLAITATDFSTGAPVVFRSGPLVDPVRASCAYPGMFLPVRMDGRWLVDGMLAYAVPTIPLRQMGARRVLGVHLKGTWTNGEGPRHLFDVIGQCFNIALEKSSREWRRAADLTIEPNVTGCKYDDFEHTTNLIQSGEVAARAALPEIRRWIEREKAKKTPPAAIRVTPATAPAE